MLSAAKDAIAQAYYAGLLTGALGGLIIGYVVCAIARRSAPR